MSDPNDPNPEAELAAAAEEAAPEEAEHEEVLEPAEDGGSVELLELVLQAHAERTARAKENSRIDGVVIGAVVSVGEDGAVRVTYPGCPTPEEGALARSTAAITPASAGREVALMFEGGDVARPLVMGLIVNPSSQPRPHVVADEEKIELSAAKEITLRCGEASITLTRAGKILLRGAYISSRASGVQRIRGGSVQIN